MIVLKRIAELRKEKGINQVGLALKLNVSQKMISAYENGLHQPGIDTLIQLSKIFNVSVDYLIGNSDIKLPTEYYLTDRLTETEIEMLNLFKNLDKKTQQRAIGVIYALAQI